MYRRFAGDSPEVVPEQFLLNAGPQRLVMPLPPLVDPGRSSDASYDIVKPISPWEGNDQVGSPPEIPVRASAGTPQDPAQAPPVPGPGETPPDQIDPFNARQGSPTATPEEPATVAGQDPDYLLFRFFDYTIEPGRQYRYRVQLMMKNPNFGVDPRHLTDPALAKQRFIPGPEQLAATENWPMTDVVYVPRDTRVLAGAVKSPRPEQYGVEPTGKLLLVTFAMQTGRKAHQEISVSRGLVANKLGCTFPPKPPAKRAGGDDGGFTAVAPAATERRDTISVDYVTDAVVLDMRGGERLPGRDRLEAPGEILILNADGRLVVHRELDDLPDYLERLNVVTPDTGPRPSAEPRVGPHGERADTFEEF
jgi:hypothetical protein